MFRPSPRTLGGFGFFALALVVLLFLPHFVSAFRAQQFAYVGIYFIALLGLNILTGYTGQISLGHGAFMAIGGYTMAILVANHGVKDLWTIPLAGLVAGAAGFLFGIPALRLTGLYLALATFAVAVAAPSVLKKFEGFTGGSSGLQLFGLPGLSGSITGMTVFGHHMPFNDWLYYLSWGVAVVMFAVAWLLVRGRFGRSLRAVRDSELAAVSSGVNLSLAKTSAFGISAFYAGVAGALFGIANTFVNPDSFQITLSIFLLVGIVVGGLGSLWPLVFGAVFVEFMPLWAQNLSKSPGAPSVVYGVVLIAIMLALPLGAAGLLRRIFWLANRQYRRSA